MTAPSQTLQAPAASGLHRGRVPTPSMSNTVTRRYQRFEGVVFRDPALVSAARLHLLVTIVMMMSLKLIASVEGARWVG